ncbi:MAG: ATP phosphoribosyltransferase [Melioribacteraceae bacterium]|nr:MAG: ATP phosphoribosyltransferase [Melioribacteraceae bacterium]
MNGNLKLAIQKKGRLTEKSLDLLKNCGLEIDSYKERLFVSARNFNVDILFLRDDDIPEYVQDGVADIGIVGGNVIEEKNSEVNRVRNLGFGKCKLMFGIPEEESLENPAELQDKVIATSYPEILNKYLDKNSVSAKIIEISGSVEIAPTLGVADYVCDIVSTGTTLKMNKLKKSLTVLESQAELIANKKLSENLSKINLFNELISRIDSALTAKKSKYLMMNVPGESLDSISKIIPSLKSPTIMPLADQELFAVHAVIPADRFWQIVEDLKANGASGILLLPIENMIV